MRLPERSFSTGKGECKIVPIREIIEEASKTLNNTLVAFHL